MTQRVLLGWGLRGQGVELSGRRVAPFVPIG